jgi:hypothetical protein
MFFYQQYIILIEMIRITYDKGVESDVKYKKWQAQEVVCLP